MKSSSSLVVLSSLKYMETYTCHSLVTLSGQAVKWHFLIAQSSLRMPMFSKNHENALSYQEACRYTSELEKHEHTVHWYLRSIRTNIAQFYPKTELQTSLEYSQSLAGLWQCNLTWNLHKFYHIQRLPVFYRPCGIHMELTIPTLWLCLHSPSICGPRNAQSPSNNQW
jgi:hypothetical protein